MVDRSWLAEEKRERRLYNPGPAFSAEYASEVFKFPGKDEHWVDPVSGEKYSEPGVMPVRPRFAHRKWDLEQRPPVWIKVPFTAAEVIDYLIGSDGTTGKVGQYRGVRELTPNGDAILDAQIKAEADEAYHVARTEQARASTRAHEASNAKRVAEGLTPLPPNKEVLADYEFLASGNVTKQHVCRQCYAGFGDADSLKAHVTKIHPQVATKLIADIEPVKRKRGRPRKSEAAA